MVLSQLANQKQGFNTKSYSVYNLLYLLKNDEIDLSEIIKNKYLIIWSGSKKMTHIVDNKEIAVPKNSFAYLAPNVKQIFLDINLHNDVYIFMFEEAFFAKTLAECLNLQNCPLFNGKNCVEVVPNNISNEMIFQHVFIDSILTFECASNNSEKLFHNIIDRILINGKLAYSEEQIDVKENDYDAIIATKFKELLELKVTEEHKVSFYEDHLFVTKRTLDKATLKIYNKKAKKMIVDELVRKAKILLLHTSMQIKDIAMELNFLQETNFTAFFKKNTGLSPKQYREESIKK